MSGPLAWLDAPNQFPDYRFALLADKAISLSHPAFRVQAGFSTPEIWMVAIWASTWYNASVFDFTLQAENGGVT